MTTYEYIGVGLALIALSATALTTVASIVRTRRDRQREVVALRREIRAMLRRALREALSHGV